MIVQLEVNSSDAAELLDFLNADGGLRAAVTERLIPKNRPEDVARLTAIMTALGRISSALTLALDAERQLDERWRAERKTEARRLAGLD